MSTFYLLVKCELVILMWRLLNQLSHNAQAFRAKVIFRMFVV